MAERRNPSEVQVTEMMSSDIAYCVEDDTIEQATKVMESKQIRRLPVLDRNKQLAGIISPSDISLSAEGSRQKNIAGKALEETSEPAKSKH